MFSLGEKVKTNIPTRPTRRTLLKDGEKFMITVKCAEFYIDRYWIHFYERGKIVTNLEEVKGFIENLKIAKFKPGEIWYMNPGRDDGKVTNMYGINGNKITLKDLEIRTRYVADVIFSFTIIESKKTLWRFESHIEQIQIIAVCNSYGIFLFSTNETHVFVSAGIRDPQLLILDEACIRIRTLPMCSNETNYIIVLTTKRMKTRLYEALGIFKDKVMTKLGDHDINVSEMQYTCKGQRECLTLHVRSPLPLKQFQYVFGMWSKMLAFTFGDVSWRLYAPKSRVMIKDEPGRLNVIKDQLLDNQFREILKYLLKGLEWDRIPVEMLNDIFRYCSSITYQEHSKHYYIAECSQTVFYIQGKWDCS